MQTLHTILPSLAFSRPATYAAIFSLSLQRAPATSSALRGEGGDFSSQTFREYAEISFAPIGH